MTRRVTVAEAARIIGGIKPGTIRVWISKGHLHRDNEGKIDLDLALAYARGRSLAALCIRAGIKKEHRPTEVAPP